MPAFCLTVFSIGILSGCHYQKNNKEEVIPEYVFTYAENQPEGYPTTLGAYRFAELVNERTQGRIRINVHSGGVLGDELAVIEQLQYGGIDFARVSVMTMGEVDPKLNILQLPYLYQDSAHMWRALDGEIGQEFMSSLETYQLHGLSWYDAGARHFYTTEPVGRLEDLNGKRIRVAESELMKALIHALGAVPVPMAYSDVFSALETGEIDGAENNWPSYTFTEHHKVAKYMVLDGHSRIPELQLASQATWNKLSKQDQVTIKACALESALYERQLWAEQEEASRKKAEQSGVVTTQLSDAETRHFCDAVTELYEQYGGEYQELIKRIKALNEE